MNHLRFFYRHTDPVFFSIENVFGSMARKISQKYAGEFTLDEVKMPFPSNPRSIMKNIRFAHGRQTMINHITGDIHYIILGWNRRKINILTVHDCVSLHRFSRKDPRYWVIKWLWYSWPVRKADMITVISENTKAELLRFVAIDPQKVRVIHNFVDPGFRPAKRIFNSNCPRILFIGTTPNKNLGRLIGALAGIPAILDIVGEINSHQVAALGQADIRYEQSSRLSGEELKKKYEDCDFLAFPSTYEGFGLPIVEAQAVGRPVLTSNLAPMKDIAGKGACLVDPYDINSIRDGLLKIIRREEYRKELTDAGTLNTIRFSLDAVTDEYVSLYRELLGQKSFS